MIDSYRFIARSSDRERWLDARNKGITATMVAKASTAKGFTEVVDDLLYPTAIEPNAYMEWGTLREPEIALEVKEMHGVMPNDWLICAEHNRAFMATPDGLSLDHTMIAEIKTGGKPFAGIPILYRRQIQWQLFVTGAESCVYAYERRIEQNDGSFIPDFDIHMEIVKRDSDIIAKLIETATSVLEKIDG